MNEQYRHACLSAMGITRYVLRKPLSGDNPGQPTATKDVEQVEVSADRIMLEHSGLVPATAVAQHQAVSEWQQLKLRVSNCSGCDLHRQRTQTVFGTGNENADLMIVGEAPGAEEDKQGEPFVGAAGQLLNAMLYAIGIAREQVYIANIVKCRPPGNRNPAKSEMASCRHYLDQQIELIKPRVILSVGAVSAHNLLLTEDSVGRLRQRSHQYGKQNIPLLVTYHPAYLLRSPGEKAKVWQDLQQLVNLMQ